MPISADLVAEINDSFMKATTAIATLFLRTLPREAGGRRDGFPQESEMKDIVRRMHRIVRIANEDFAEQIAQGD